MRNYLIIVLLLVFSIPSFSQKPGKTSPKITPPPTATPVSEKQAFQNARNLTSLTDKIEALKKFNENYPNSEFRTFALELLVSTRAALGDQKLSLSDNQAGIDLFKFAVIEAPTPISDKLFNEIVVQFPANLFYRNQRADADEVAKLIEEKISDNVNQILGLASFYLGTENGFEAKRLAEKAIGLAPDSAAAYQTLGFANRLNFDLEAAAAAYAKALELNPGSTVSKRNLAEMNRAIGKSAEAETLFQEVLDSAPDDVSASNGLILSMFDSGKQSDAETALTASLEKNSNNFFLLVGAAYWYAAHKHGAQAIELAQKAIAIEPRYSWAYISLARGLIQQNRPLEAERTLMIARQYGNFPTLNYEIAAARSAAGFFREAADELVKSFDIKDGKLRVNLGGRVLKEGKSFNEILAFERQASIFEPVGADDPATADRLKALLNFTQLVNKADTSESDISKAADEFIDRDDKMKVHRSLFIANQLLGKKLATAKALEITEAVAQKAEAGLDVVSPAASVMADGLYEPRTLASVRNEILMIPDVPRQTLLKILRGRIEELSGWAKLEQNKPGEAAIRFKSAASIFPEKSVWWRSSKWRLGDALDADGKPKEALAAYIDSYDTDAPDNGKRLLIELMYAKVNGSTEGLDRIIGPNRNLVSAKTSTIETADPSANTKVDDVTTDDEETVSNTSDPNPNAETSPELPKTESPENEVKIPENVPLVGAIPVKAAENPVTTGDTEKALPAETKKTTTPATNPLFETVVIKVPNSEKTRNLEESKQPDILEENKSKDADSKKAVEIPLSSPETAPDPTDAGEPVTGRARVVTGEAKKGDEDRGECSLMVGQRSIQLLNDGGSLGMFVGFSGAEGDLSKIVAVSSSPSDVSVELQTDVGVLSERAFFRFKSISAKTGVFSVIFESPCGKREVTVTVR